MFTGKMRSMTCWKSILELADIKAGVRRDRAIKQPATAIYVPWHLSSARCWLWRFSSL
jgi:hypothetical protein